MYVFLRPIKLYISAAMAKTFATLGMLCDRRQFLKHYNCKFLCSLHSLCFVGITNIKIDKHKH